MDPRIADFIRDNRQRYTREVIRQQLIDAGHDPAEIDATWAALDAPDPDATAGEGFWGRFALFLVGLNVAVFLLVFLATGMVNSFVLAVVFAVALSIGALIAWALVAATGPAQMGRTTAVVIGGVIPLVFALLIGGSCYALAGAIPPPPPPAASGVMELHINPPLSFDGSGRATCQPYSGGDGFSIYGESLGVIDGRMLTASFESFGTAVEPDGGPAPAPAPGANANINLYVYLQPSAEADPPRDWFVIPGTEVEIDPASDAFSGTVTFDGLGTPPDAGVGDSDDVISGTLSWTCEEVAP
jgi:hypothetical protein